MHSALQIDEIICQILDQLTKSSDLCAIALTCRALHAPAVALIWSSLENLTPLVKLLVVRRHPTVVDWGRWMIYAIHVREIRSLRIKHIILNLLETPPLPEGLLPNLRKVTINSWHSNHTLLIRLISGTNLRNLSFGSKYRNLSCNDAALFTDYCSFLTNPLAPSLTALDIYHLQQAVPRPKPDPRDPTEGVKLTMARAIGAQKALRYLRIQNILDLPFTFLYEIAHLPHLSSLKMGLHQPHGPPVAPLSLELPAGFSSLTDLDVWSESLFAKQLDTILLPTHSSLRKLSLASFWTPESPLLPESIMSLVHLEELYLVVIDRNISTRRELVATQGHQSLLALTCLRHLRRVSLMLPAIAGPGRVLLQRLAQAWPRLEHLSFDRSFPTYYLGDLVSLARHCPDLIFLNIPAPGRLERSSKDNNCSEPTVSYVAPKMATVMFRASRRRASDVVPVFDEVLRFWPNATVKTI